MVTPEFLILWLSCCVQMEIEIFYQLVLSNGASYKGSTVDAVSVKPNANIIHLRKAVKAENPNDLAHVDPRNLTVYKTKADLGNKQPLEVDFAVAALGAIGQTKETALVVVVPNDTDHGLTLIYLLS